MIYRLLGRLRFVLAQFLALLGAATLVGGIAAFIVSNVAMKDRVQISLVFLTVTAVSWWAAFRLDRPRSRGYRTGHLVLFEAPLQGVTSTHTPALTIRGARDAVERFIPRDEFGALFGGWALWSPPSDPTPDLPGEALGVWSRRMCKRFRRILRERGATLDVRHEPGPRQRIAKLVRMYEDGECH